MMMSMSMIMMVIFIIIFNYLFLLSIGLRIFWGKHTGHGEIPSGTARSDYPGERDGRSINSQLRLHTGELL